jgi:hypothetical protein
MLDMHPKRAEPQSKPRLFIFTKDSKDRRVVPKTSKGAGSVDSTTSGLTTILLREDLFPRQGDVIKISKDMVYIYFAGNGDIPTLGHKVSKGHLCSWRDL